MTAEKAAEMGCTPLAKIVGYADGATDPIDFPIAPKFALDKLMAQVFWFPIFSPANSPKLNKMLLIFSLDRLEWLPAMLIFGRSTKPSQLLYLQI